jgi:hypothetical protein
MGVVGGIRGVTLRSGTSHFQCACTVSRARSHRVGQLRLRGASARKKGHGALQEYAWHGSVMFTLGWERKARSRCSRHVGDQARVR